jgi:hypothetical protein
MQSHSILLILSVSALMIYFMTSLKKRFWPSVVGLAGTLLHLMGVIRWPAVHAADLLEGVGVILWSIAFLWMLFRSPTQLNGRHA